MFILLAWRVVASQSEAFAPAPAPVPAPPVSVTALLFSVAASPAASGQALVQAAGVSELALRSVAGEAAPPGAALQVWTAVSSGNGTAWATLASAAAAATWMLRGTSVVNATAGGTTTLQLSGPPSASVGSGAGAILVLVTASTPAALTCANTLAPGVASTPLFDDLFATASQGAAVTLVSGSAPPAVDSTVAATPCAWASLQLTYSYNYNATLAAANAATAATAGLPLPPAACPSALPPPPPAASLPTTAPVALALSLADLMAAVANPSVLRVGVGAKIGRGG